MDQKLPLCLATNLPFPLLSSSSLNFDISKIDKPAFITRRWQSPSPDPLHALHDDLLPIFHTMKHFCFGDADQCLRDYMLVFEGEEGDDEHPLDYLYQLVTPTLVLPLRAGSASGSPSELLCFSKALVGVDDETVWYDHGFEDTQRTVDNINLRPHYLEHFRRFFLGKVERKTERPDGDVDVLFLYPESVGTGGGPQILNAEGLTPIMRSQFSKWLSKDPVRVIHRSVDAADQDAFLQTLRDVSAATVLVTPHGPLSVLSLFLGPRAAHLELFPFATGPSSFPFARSLALKRGTPYGAWVNEDEAKTTPHPEAIPAKGGLRHLDPEAREKLQSLKDLPPTRFGDPAYLYRLHQDTLVDTVSFAEAFSNLCEDLTAKSIEAPQPAVVDEAWLLPSRVSQFECLPVRRRRDAREGFQGS